MPQPSATFFLFPKLKRPMKGWKFAMIEEIITASLEELCFHKKKDRIINFEIPPTDHLTKKLILNSVEDSRSAPTRIPNQHQSVMG